MKGSDGSVSTLNQRWQRGQQMGMLGHSPVFALTDRTGSCALTSRLLGASWRRRRQRLQTPHHCPQQPCEAGGGRVGGRGACPDHAIERTKPGPPHAGLQSHQSLPALAAHGPQGGSRKAWLKEWMACLGPVSQWGSLTTASPALLKPGAWERAGAERLRTREGPQHPGNAGLACPQKPLSRVDIP